MPLSVGAIDDYADHHMPNKTKKRARKTICRILKMAVFVRVSSSRMGAFVKKTKGSLGRKHVTWLSCLLLCNWQVWDQVSAGPCQGTKFWQRRMMHPFSDSLNRFKRSFRWEWSGQLITKVGLQLFKQNCLPIYAFCVGKNSRLKKVFERSPVLLFEADGTAEGYQLKMVFLS